MDDSINDFFQGVVGVVEANSFETGCLYNEYHLERKKTWVQNRGGYLQTVGHCSGRPVVISLFVNEVDGHRILFLDPTSQVVDYKLIDDWLKTNLPPTALNDHGRVNKVDAMNFHNVFPRTA